MYIPKAAHQCDVKENSSITTIEKENVLFLFKTYIITFLMKKYFCLVKSYPHNKEILAICLKSGSSKVILKYSLKVHSLSQIFETLLVETML